MIKQRHIEGCTLTEYEEKRIQETARDIVDKLRYKNLTFTEAMEVLEECKILIECSEIK